MKIENARVKCLDIDNSEAVDYSRRMRYSYDRDALRYNPHYIAPLVTAQIMLPPGVEDMLPHDLANRKITIIVEPTPGEAAYAKHVETRMGYPGRVQTWESLNRCERDHWERVAEAAIKAK